METFSYTAFGKDGGETTGRIEAANADEARRLLEQGGLRVREVRPVVGTLTAGETEEFTRAVAQFSDTQVPLGLGLRAAAEESSSPRVAAALRVLAIRVEQGSSLEDAMRAAGETLPTHVRGLLLAAQRTGRMAEALADLVELRSETASLRRGIAAAFAYPLIVGGLALVVMAVVGTTLIATFEQMFLDFELRLPMLTVVLIWWYRVGMWWTVGAIGGIVCLAFAYRSLFGRARWDRLAASIPLFGPLGYWLSVAEWSGLLRVLVKHQVPLPEALRFAAGGTRNVYVSRSSLALAEGASQGRTISQMLAGSRRLPQSLIPLIRWGEETGGLADALGTGSEMLQQRVLKRSMLLRSILPPILFIAVACCIVFVVSSLFLPLINLIEGLS